MRLLQALRDGPVFDGEGVEDVLAPDASIDSGWNCIIFR
jgi:hypothetical protein